MNIIKKAYNKINTIGFRKTFIIIYSKFARPFAPKFYDLLWKLKSKHKGFTGVSNKKREIPLIVSLTTYPGRINGIHYVIKTLLMQTVKPDMIILWLAVEQFPNKEKDLPENLLELCKYGLAIEWCNDIRSYKKLIPTVKKYPDAVIVTTDDDMYYHPKMVQRLYEAYLKDPSCIQCHRATKFTIENGSYKTTPGGYDVYTHPSFLNKLTGCSGVLYPPNSLHKDLVDDSLFMSLIPTNDDIWFWFMGLLANTKTNVPASNYANLYFVKDSQNTSLCGINDSGEKLFWIQFKNMLEHYPQIDEILRSEWEKEKMNFAH